MPEPIGPYGHVHYEENGHSLHDWSAIRDHFQWWQWEKATIPLFIYGLIACGWPIILDSTTPAAITGRRVVTDGVNVELWHEIHTHTNTSDCRNVSILRPEPIDRLLQTSFPHACSRIETFVYHSNVTEVGSGNDIDNKSSLLGTEMATNRYLNQRWLSSIMECDVTKPE